jgi:2-phospho-L-lactate/phosphoenolpyruvate guanylyltransferase
VRILNDWHVIVPIKQGGDGKSRLGAMLGNDARSDLAERMAAHVLGVLQTCFDASCITILSPQWPSNWEGEWKRDEGRGLNKELTAWRASQGKAAILIIHADLPLVSTGDVSALISATDLGIALATDRAGQGTNALVIADGRAFTLCFGANSRALHCAQYPEMPVLEREGLMADLDTPDDADFVAARGFHI